VEAAIRARLDRGECIKKVAKAIGVGNGTVRGQSDDGSLTGLGADPGGQARAAKHFRRTSGLCSKCTELYLYRGIAGGNVRIRPAADI